MLLFVTMRPHTLPIERRLRNFANLKISVRHFSIARHHVPDIWRSFQGVRLALRIGILLSGIFRLRRALKTITSKDVLFVDAHDALAATLAARFLSRNRSRLICQVLDVHYLLLYPSIYRSTLRALERWTLNRIDLLIVPTHGNIDQYYGPIARFRGEAAVVHNKLPTGEAANPLPAPSFEGTWVIGWFGSLRCERTLEILCRTAELMGSRVKILAAGNCDLPRADFERAIGRHSNILYLGNFHAPNDAARLYGQVHIACGLHFEPPDKSKWALAVRILEGGAYGRPAIARADSDMGRFVADNGTGWTLSEPCEQELPKLLGSLTWESYCRVAARVRDRSDLFIGEDHLVAALGSLPA